MKTIKVCHVITRLELGGAQGNTLYTVRHLDRSRFAPSLIAGKGGILDREARSLPGTAVHLISGLVRPVLPPVDLFGLVQLWYLFIRERPVIVHTHSSKAGILGRIAARLAGVPVVVHTIHGFGFNDFQRPAVRRLYVALERFTDRLTDRLIAVAAEDIRRGLANGIGTPDKYVLIRSGIDTARYKNARVDRVKARGVLGIPPDAEVVTTIGPFKPQKNLVDFIDAAADIRRRRPNTVFLVVGDGEQRGLLEERIAARGLGAAVRLLGWRTDIAEILSISDVFVMTSLWEGLPRAVLEAMCCGLPVVANAVDGVREVVRDGETGFLTPPHAVAATADRVVSLLEDPARAAAMGGKGRQSIDRQFDIDHMVRQQEDLYASLVAAPR